MPVSFDIIVRRVGSAANAIAGSQAAAFEASYNTSPLLAAQFDGATFTYSMITDAILSAQARIAQTIADTKKHLFRRNLSDTVTVANNAAISTNAASGRPIIGVYGDVRTELDGILMMPTSMEEIARYQQTPGIYARGPINLYYISDTGVFNATTQDPVNFIIECCSYSRTEEAAALAAHEDILLPDSLEDLLVAGGIASLNRDGQSADANGFFGGYFAQGLKLIQSGQTTLIPPAINVPMGNEARAA